MTRRQRLAALAIALCATFVLVAQLPANAATWAHLYAVQVSGTAVKGIDGYVRTSQTVPLSPSQGHAHWINLSTSTTTWQQIGQYQGSSWAFSAGDAASHVREYYENNGACGYLAHDLGYAAAPNTAYYITMSTSSITSCGLSAYVSYFRVGSYTSAPVASGSPTAATGKPQAGTELIILGSASLPPVNQDRFGLTDSGVVSAGHGLHLLTTSTWLSWTSAVAPVSITENQPPYYIAKSA